MPPTMQNQAKHYGGKQYGAHHVLANCPTLRHAGQKKPHEGRERDPPRPVENRPRRLPIAKRLRRRRSPPSQIVTDIAGIARKYSVKPPTNISPAKAVAPNTIKITNSSQDSAILRFESQRIPRPMPDKAESMAARVSRITASERALRLVYRRLPTNPRP